MTTRAKQVVTRVATSATAATTRWPGKRSVATAGSPAAPVKRGTTPGKRSRTQGLSPKNK